MCSVSWLQNNQSLSICFNRDEQISRSKAHPPQPIFKNGVTILSPTDPDGGGTWLSVNDYAITLCLLNLYEFQTINNDPAKPKISRGILVHNLAFCTSLENVITVIQQQDLAQFQPFRLLFISPTEKQELRWDGRNFEQYALPSFCSSSSVETQSVIQQRIEQFAEYHPQDVKAQLNLHQSHYPQKGAYSICMHRDDATTVSLSHLFINQNQVIFNYHNGSPCENHSSTTNTLMLNPHTQKHMASLFNNSFHS